MKRAIFFILMVLLVFPFMVYGQETYRWVDEKGTINFTDDPTLIPERYRGQVQKKNPPQESPSPSARPAPEGSRPARPQEQVESAPEKKDRLGRGEDWWRGKVKEWNDKLAEAQRGFDGVQATLKGKEKELQEAKFKPDSLKRRLKVEKDALEERVKEWEKQVGEAKNMLDKVLPKEAQDYGADPEWLKPKE